MAARGIQNLDAMLNPRSVAVIGASNDPARVGGMPLRFLLEAGYGGEIYPVNPRATVVQGLPSFSDVGDVGTPIDLAIVAVAAERVLPVIEECIAAGVRSSVIFSAGFAETGPRGAALQKEIRRLTGESGLRVCGPNCAGIINVVRRVPACFGSHLAADPTLVDGSIAIVSQSGAVGAYVYTLARQRGIGLSYWVTTGNEADTQSADFIEALAEDPDTDVLALYLEEIRDPEAFAQSCALATRHGKRIVGLMPGSSSEGQRVLQSHTAAMTSDWMVASRALEEAGVARAASIEELMTTAVGLRSPARPLGRRVGLVTVSGGVGILMVDRCAELGLTVPRLPDSLQSRLNKVLPYASTRNPLDVTGNISNDPGIFKRFLQELIDCSDIDVVVCFLGHVLLSPHLGNHLLGELVDVAARTQKPIWLVGTAEDSHQMRALADAGIPLLVDPVRAMDALHTAVISHERGSIDPGATLLARRQAPLVYRRLNLPAPERSRLSELEAQAILEPSGVRFPGQIIATTAVEAEAAVAAFDRPCVMKLLSPDISHKTDVDGVRLGVPEERAVETFRKILSSALLAAPDAEIQGVLVQEMVDGFPVIIGTKLDAAFGPVVLVGAGGIYAEILPACAVALAPVDRDQAIDLLNRTGIGRILESHRGRPALAYDALVELIVAVSRLAWGARDRVATLELNPVLVGTVEAVAVDALVEMTARDAAPLAAC